MVDQGRGGRIVNVTSVHEHTPIAEGGAYTVAKHGLGGLTKQLAPEFPLGRPGAAREIASCIAWLCSPDARWAAGASFLVDGGFMLVNPSEVPIGCDERSGRSVTVAVRLEDPLLVAVANPGPVELVLLEAPGDRFHEAVLLFAVSCAEADDTEAAPRLGARPDGQLLGDQLGLGLRGRLDGDANSHDPSPST